MCETADFSDVQVDGQRNNYSPRSDIQDGKEMLNEETDQSDQADLIERDSNEETGLIRKR